MREYQQIDVYIYQCGTEIDVVPDGLTDVEDKNIPPTFVGRFCLFALMVYVPVNNFSVMSGQFPVFLG